ncbi:glucose-6-phosphate 1-dehydrogenase [Gamsiella multidivaricata]|uniref:glucose-6-phosphate 1-dehydrogenase n=1 Tax=Gamsiella multidivaricata TaxID=101098 RepID=UPI00221F564F|nr:glucose-6-phosphate 1-dehydrogenase [Gamsiella multidivaricata]KAI7817045.1 glucose-6-phosphate 1-dehydrogenase [Gamsiella multidivaricata]
MTTSVTAQNGRPVFTIVVLGASGDLAKKKTFPALFGLFLHGHISPTTRIIGYARTKMDRPDYLKRISQYIKNKTTPKVKAALEQFLDQCTYVSGVYDQDSGFQDLEKELQRVEKEIKTYDRLFYMALPPSVFIPVANGLKKNCYTTKGINRLIVEKPFGMDLESSRTLQKALGALYREDEIYRIDHYLGKEMVKNIMILRFTNQIFGSCWDKDHISNVQITFKEKIGTEGRGGYFDEFGIMRDVMQNHLFQILSLIAMETPASLEAEDIRNAKVDVLRAIPEVVESEVLLGQYGKSEDGTMPSYLDDETVPKGSKTATFAAAAFHINNPRWEGVPFVLKCGKALDQQKVEIRIQFKDMGKNLFQKDVAARNELVIRVQPQEAVYLKMTQKLPGLGMETVLSELDLSYASRFTNLSVPDAYENLILDAIMGEQSNFVRSDELDEAWRIFTPVLHKIDRGQVPVEIYPYGSRGPKHLPDFVARFGFERHAQTYSWPETSQTAASNGSPQLGASASADSKL